LSSAFTSGRPARIQRAEKLLLVERWLATPPGRDGHLCFVICDDGSTDGTADVLRDPPPGTPSTS
jgi:hypothetical protein